MYLDRGLTSNIFNIHNSPFSVVQRLRVSGKFLLLFFVTFGRAPKKGRGEGVIKIGNKIEILNIKNKCFSSIEAEDCICLIRADLGQKWKNKT
jgi:hypothetical protein